MSDIKALMARRARLLGPNVSTFYADPVHIVKGDGVWLWDADGRKYLDCYNNVPHVGHYHPKVVEAIARQAAILNTHTRYLHEGILDYIEALTAKFDKSLTSAIMVCSGSEANDVALRMAQAVTGNTGVIATDMTYHGNTAAVSQLSTRRPPIGGYADHVQHVPAPDSTRPLGVFPVNPLPTHSRSRLKGRLLHFRHQATVFPPSSSARSLPMKVFRHCQKAFWTRPSPPFARPEALSLPTKYNRVLAAPAPIGGVMKKSESCQK